MWQRTQSLHCPCGEALTCQHQHRSGQSHVMDALRCIQSHRYDLITRTSIDWISDQTRLSITAVHALITRSVHLYGKVELATPLYSRLDHYNVSAACFLPPWIREAYLSATRHWTTSVQLLNTFKSTLERREHTGITNTSEVHGVCTEYVNY